MVALIHNHKHLHILLSYDATAEGGGLSAETGDTNPALGLGCATVIGLIAGWRGGVILFRTYGDVVEEGIVIDIGSSIGVFCDVGWTGIGLSNTSIPP